MGTGLGGGPLGQPDCESPREQETADLRGSSARDTPVVLTGWQLRAASIRLRLSGRLGYEDRAVPSQDGGERPAALGLHRPRAGRKKGRGDRPCPPRFEDLG